MRPEIAPSLAHRLPLPLAQLYRRAHNARTPLERHLAGYYLWEAGLKLLASVAVVEYAATGDPDPILAERLHNLARPALGHWWEFVRLLVPVLADRGDAAFGNVRDLLLAEKRVDLPRVAGLDSVLGEALEDRHSAQSTVRLAGLLDRLVRYRNREIGHGATGQRPASFYDRVGTALMAGAEELFARLDPLAGRRLLHVVDVRQVAGRWSVERLELVGTGLRRLAPVEIPLSAGHQLPLAGCVYLHGPAEADESPRLLHPLLLFDPEPEEVLFLNARRGRQRTEYLCYTTGRTADRPDLGVEQRELLTRVLGMAVAEEQTTEWAAQSQSDDPPADSPIEAGGERPWLGDYELRGELGRGAMGVVYRAWQASLGREVALKVLTQSGNKRAEERFRREIRAMGRVQHPHLVKVFASGSAGDRWFYVMELVEGAPLAAVWDQLTVSTRPVDVVDEKTWREAVSTVCEKNRRGEERREAEAPPVAPALSRTAAVQAGPAYVRQVVELVRQVAEAAQALHEKGVIHRDIKPGNIMVTADGKNAVLVDLGLAQLADADNPLTQTRHFVGTPRYASPQQVLAAGKLDLRTDVYSLGATLWEMLALRPLFVAATDEAELLEMIQRKEPGRLRSLDLGIPRDLDAIVQKSLEKSPENRYATAKDLADDLGRWLRDEPVKARLVGPVGRLSRWCRRQPLVAALSVLILFVSTALLIALLLLLRAGWQKRPDAGKDRITDENPPLLVTPPTLKAEVKPDTELKETAAAHYNVGLNLREQGKLDEAVAKFQAAIRVDTNYTSAHISLGKTLADQRKLDEAVAEYRTAIDLEPENVTSLNHLALLYKDQGQYAKAEPLLRQALEVRKKALGESHPDYAQSLNNLASLYQAQGDYAKAEPLLRQAQEVRKKALRKAHPD